MKKIVTLLLFMVCFCGLVGCGVKPVSDAKLKKSSPHGKDVNYTIFSILLMMK